MNESKIIQLKSWVERKAANPERKIMDVKIVRFLADYAEADRAVAVGERLAGEIYWLYFKADVETQREFIRSLARSNRVHVPEEATARQQLILAVYGRTAELTEVRKGEHDSLGGKRITAALRAYAESTGRRPRKKKTSEGWPRTTGKFLQEIFERATSSERRTLDRLLDRIYGRSYEKKERAA